MKSRPRPVTGRFCASVTAEEGTIGKNPSYLINNFFQKNRNPLFLNSADPYFRKHLFLLVSLSCGRKKKKKKRIQEWETPSLQSERGERCCYLGDDGFCFISISKNVFTGAKSKGTDPAFFETLNSVRQAACKYLEKLTGQPLDEPQCKDVKLTLSHFPRFLPSLESKRKFTLKKKLLSEFLVAQRDEALALSFSCCGAGSVPGLGISICLGCSKNIFFFTAETF